MSPIAFVLAEPAPDEQPATESILDQYEAQGLPEEDAPSETPVTEEEAPAPTLTIETKQAVDASLDAEEQQIHDLEEETARLMRLMVAKGYVHLEKPQEGLRTDAIEFPPKNALMKPVYDRVKDLKGQMASKDKVIFKVYQKHYLREGDSIYKVAVSDSVLTLDEALEVAKANSLAARAAKKKIEVAEAKWMEARRALFPSVAIVVEFTGGKAGASGTNIGGRLYKGESQKINIQQPLFYGGELVYTAKQAEANLRTSEAEYAKAVGDLLATVTTNYYGLVKSEYNLKYQSTLFEEIETIYKRVREERLRKLISDVDFLNAQSQYHQAFFTLESVKNDHLSNRLTFFQSIYVDFDDEAQLDLQLDFDKVEVDLYEAIDYALKHNPDIHTKELAVESAEMGIKIYKAKRLPKMDLRGSWGMLGEVFKDDKNIETDNHDLDTEKEWFIGFGGSIPIGISSAEYETIKHVYGPTALSLQGSEDWKHKATFNLWDRLQEDTDAKNADATYLQALFDLDKAKNDTIIRIKDEFYNMQKSLLQIDSSLSKLRYQEKQVQSSRYLSSFQEVSAAALFETLTEYASAKFSFIQAAADYHIAVSSLNIAMGDPGHFKSKS